MILQKILFPEEEICNETELYFKGKKFVCENDSAKILSGGFLSASTYFNSFSLEKWKRYTAIDNLQFHLCAKGDFSVSLCVMTLADEERTEKKFIDQTIFHLEEKTEVSLKFDINVNGIVFWELTALSDVEFFGGYYETDLKDRRLNRVKLAIGICTYRREQFVIANLNRLSEACAKDGILHGNVKVIVSDNGQSLPAVELENDFISVVYNKNLGGAGGFTRCLIEAYYRKFEEFTNFLFLDDDIILSVAAIEKTFVLLSLLLPEYQNCVVGGAMFSTDDKYLQFESAAKWKGIGFEFNRRDIDMRDNLNILLNEQPYDVNYNAWCYCCIPFKAVTDTNLPLPVFFHMDDVEYGLRNQFPVITMNGINVWHLYKKVLINAKNDYYDVRNRLIMLSELNPETVPMLAYTYLNSFTREALKYHYARAINAFDGVLDFCKGFEWFKKLNTIEKHGKLYNNVRWEKSTDAIEKRARISLNAEANRSGKKYKLKKAFRQLFPATEKMPVVINDNSEEDAVNARRVCVYVPSEKQCIVYSKSRYLSFICFIKHKKVVRAINKKLNTVVDEYRHRITELQTLQFWEQYLNLPPSVRPHKKVLFVASDNDSTSGAFRSMVALNSELKERFGIETCVLLPKDGDGGALLRAAGIRYTLIDSEDWIVRMNTSDYELRRKKKKIKQVNSRAVKTITQFIKEEKFDLVHINTSWSYVGAISAMRAHVPVVWHIREFLEEDQERRMVDRRRGYSLMSKADAVIAISKSIQQKYQSLLRSDCLVQIYNGIDVRKFYAPQKEIFNGNKTVFICVGTIVRYKGQHYLVEALGKLKSKYEFPFEIWLVGNDKTEYAKEILSLIAEYHLEKSVKFFGRRQDVETLYAKADVACVCSRSEAFGRITVEAMLSGNLVIGANTAGTKELIGDEDAGLLYEVGDSDSLCDKILYALEHKEDMKKLAAYGREKAAEHFTASKNAEEVYHVYERIWNKK